MKAVRSGIEIYKGKPILYGLANFIFENETLLRQPPENYASIGLTPESGAGVGDFNERRSNNDTIGFPADARIWESVIAMPRFAGKQLVELKLYPITLGYKKPRPQRGWPMLADPQLGRKIVDDIARFSENRAMSSTIFLPSCGSASIGQPRCGRGFLYPSVIGYNFSSTSCFPANRGIAITDSQMRASAGKPIVSLFERRSLKSPTPAPDSGVSPIDA